MKLVVRQSTLTGAINSSPSKSVTHRAFIMASLAEGMSAIKNPLLGEDTEATLGAVAALGATVLKAKSEIKITGNGLRVPDNVIDVKNSGTTMRIIACVASLLDGVTVITGDASIRRRPMQQLLDALTTLGASCRSTRNNGCAPLVIEGIMKGGAVSTREFVSSQFTSGLLIACPLAKNDSVIEIPSNSKSKPYTDITLDMLRTFGIEFDEKSIEDKKLISLKGGQRYAPQKYMVSGDFSSAAFLLANAAISGEKVTVRNLDVTAPQGDKAILPLLQAFGADVKIDANKKTVTVSSVRRLIGQTIDCANIPDLFPILCILGAHAEGETKLFNAAHLRYKESDRIAAMAAGLEKMGAVVKEREDGILIAGGKPLKGASIDAKNDHRILMAFAIAGLNAKGVTTISDAESHRVSYPAFIDDLKKLGAAVEVRA